MNQVYLDTARLMIQIAPLVFADNVFALKGGTAINLFVRDMPRLSVDLDLVFVDHRLDRDEALARINEAIRNSVDRLKKRGFQTHAATVADAGETKLFVGTKLVTEPTLSPMVTFYGGLTDEKAIYRGTDDPDTAGGGIAWGADPGGLNRPRFPRHWRASQNTASRSLPVTGDCCNCAA